MEDELKELYQQVILDHNKSPRNFHKLDDATNDAEGYNPLCGDQINVYLKIKDNKIEDISFVGHGCAISKASASLMTSTLKGKTIEEAEEIFTKFHNLLTGKYSEDNLDELGKLAVFYGVREFPSRIKCASLPWHTFISALKQNDKNIVNTEK
ncbi:MAG: SUF system NifU family Fe-S cluster assembly protein [Ignavibacterium sp.]